MHAAKNLFVPAALVKACLVVFLSIHFALVGVSAGNAFGWRTGLLDSEHPAILHTSLTHSWISGRVGFRPW